MKFYHGSPRGDLKKLTMENAKHGAIYMAVDYCFAVFYAGCVLRFWDTDENGRLIICEKAENGLEILYKNKPCYVYSVDEKDVKDYKITEQNRRKAIETTHDVELSEVEYIPDALEKILQLEKDGKLLISRWKDLTEEQKEQTKGGLIKKFAPVMQIEYDKFYDEYILLTTLFPELKLENLKNLENN